MSAAGRMAAVNRRLLLSCYRRGVAGALPAAALSSTSFQGSSKRRSLSTAAAAAAAPRTTTTSSASFPALCITADGVSARGSFAETQAQFMTPDTDAVSTLDAALEEKGMGVVAHFYMDAELQGTLAALRWRHVAIADSLAMGDAAVRMAADGATSIACLGVDFMSESVKATLDASGYTNVPVYRLSEKEIGCSLAGAAERLEYEAWLRKAARHPGPSLHVVYINTSLITKAKSHSIVPTITCTSSNVVNTILTAFAQVPDLTIWYGPDTYMGANLESMLRAVAAMPDERIRALHPAHDRASLASLLPRFRYFKQGNCVVHHMFGDAVVAKVREGYGGAYHTAHLEVPGEMFELAMEASHGGRGVVGSTSDILKFIKARAEDAAPGEPLQIVLGTESGMITSIVRGVQSALRARSDGGRGVAIEIVFPVADGAFTATGEAQPGLETVPGVAGGEGCSTAGGCATCPFMKMNDLDSLMDLVRGVPVGSGKVPPALAPFLPPMRSFSVGGRDATALGVEPILHMRALMKGGALPDALVADIGKRAGKA